MVLFSMDKWRRRKLTPHDNDDQPPVPGNGFASLDGLSSWAVQGTYRF
jgi:hypothetical protein